MKRKQVDSSTLTSDEIAEYLGRYECHLCRNGPRKGDKNPRAALLQHFRMSKDATHKLWREAYWRQFVQLGGDRVNRELTVDEAQSAFTRTFPHLKCTVQHC